MTMQTYVVFDRRQLTVFFTEITQKTIFTVHKPKNVINLKEVKLQTDTQFNCYFFSLLNVKISFKSAISSIIDGICWIKLLF